jgi:organic radical activating enzyme
MTDRIPYCVMPYIGISTDSTGGYKPCVTFDNVHSFKGNSFEDYINSDWLTNLKQTHLLEILPQGCRMCKMREEKNIVSTRQRGLNEFTDKENLQEINKTNTFKIAYFTVSNLCNQACIMCTPKLSSKIYNEINPSHMEHYVQAHDNINSMWKNVNLSKPYTNNNIKKIIDRLDENAIVHISGGEPMVNKQVIFMLEYLLEKDLNKTINLQLVSNFQSYNTKIINLLSNFKGIALASVDAIGEKLSYIRYESNWENIKNNLFLFKKNCDNFKLMIKPTVSILNILYLDELFDWAEQNNFEVRANNRIVNPDFLSINILPKKYIPDIIEKYSKYKMPIIDIEELKYHLSLNNNDDSLTKKFFMEIAKNDSNRKLKLEKVLPELKKMLENG